MKIVLYICFRRNHEMNENKMKRSAFIVSHYLVDSSKSLYV